MVFACFAKIKKPISTSSVEKKVECLMDKKFFFKNTNYKHSVKMRLYLPKNL